MAEIGDLKMFYLHKILISGTSIIVRVRGDDRKLVRTFGGKYIDF